jgi:hypothetical protein
LVFK